MYIKCLVKFTRYPIKIDLNGSPIRSGNGKLPYLQIGQHKYVGYQKIKELMDRGVNSAICTLCNSKTIHN